MLKQWIPSRRDPQNPHFPIKQQHPFFTSGKKETAAGEQSNFKSVLSSASIGIRTFNIEKPSHMQDSKFYTDREERANWLTHAFGIVMALVATFLFIQKSIAAKDLLALIAYSIFSVGMLACMSASTFYHLESRTVQKGKLRHFDHASIYLLIASSYAPFTLILLRDNRLWSWTLFLLVWIIAVVGIILSFRKLKRNSHLKTISYVGMGLVVLVAFKPLIEAARAKECMDVVFWLIAGGVFYIVGAVIYALAKREFVHALFHIFVLLGMGCHILSAYLIPVS